MEGHYFDIETYSPGLKPDPITDRIISIQFQKVDLKSGDSIGELQILKEWEDGEEEIVKFIHKWFFQRNPWQFIPIGFNLNFEWKFLCAKFKQYNLKTQIYSKEEGATSKSLELGDFVENMPQIDLKVLAVLKKGSFIGASLSSISEKQDDGHVIKEFYENKEYKNIENYIKEETKAFLELFKKIKINIENIV
jgi:DNA polymerase elongation subunit (family B)